MGLWLGGARSLSLPDEIKATIPTARTCRALFRFVLFQRTMGLRHGGHKLSPLYEIKTTSPRARAYRVECADGYS